MNTKQLFLLGGNEEKGKRPLLLDKFYQLANNVGPLIIITGALGLLGKQHIDAIAQNGATPIILDLDHQACEEHAKKITKK